MDGVCIRVGPTIKYLGLTLDGRWGFGPHFRQLVPRVRKAGQALVGLMRTQVLTGYSCFGKYLQRIGKEPTTECHHCPERKDMAHHTLTLCPAWSQERRVLARAVVCRVEALSFPRMVPTETTMSGQHLRQMEGESTPPPVCQFR
ncbi:uncharacterized protein LOC112589062 [Harpegnathos saltator]|uniref:uncharacterized protein LOC112589062 n=1 Tax=Harpegnathos saltator TaxID=610380 RepID=UPI000DBEDA38|nr:uncharacterized protein LOC112589062 [Harpegnathos saltator]